MAHAPACERVPSACGKMTRDTGAAHASMPGWKSGRRRHVWLQPARRTAARINPEAGFGVVPGTNRKTFTTRSK
jgi:GTP-dependent phosphoenolpyruvate carboxykinase